MLSFNTVTMKKIKEQKKQPWVYILAENSFWIGYSLAVLLPGPVHFAEIS